MSKNKLTDIEICRIHDLHKLGVPNTRIADELGVSIRTTKRHYEKYPPELLRKIADEKEKEERRR